jgi:hypothetical protein
MRFQKIHTLKYKTLYQSAQRLIHQCTKPKSCKTKIRAHLPVGPKGNPRGTPRPWHLPSIFYLRQDNGQSPPCPTRVALFSKPRKNAALCDPVPRVSGLISFMPHNCAAKATSKQKFVHGSVFLWMVVALFRLHCQLSHLSAIKNGRKSGMILDGGKISCASKTFEASYLYSHVVVILRLV